MVVFRPRTGPGTGLTRVALGSFPTPFEPAPRLSAALGGPPVFIKREDLSGLALGGNKTRQAEALFAAAIEAGADTVLATAAAQSNFCRTVAAAGAKLGLEVHLLLRGEKSLPVTGNLLLDALLGAHVEFIPTRDAYDPAIAARLNEIMTRLLSAGRRPHLLHMNGAAAIRGAASYIPMAEELQDQFRAAGLRPAALYLVASSGQTAAGLLAGFRALGERTRIMGICAQTPPAFLHPRILQRASEAAELLGLDISVRPNDVELDGTCLGPGYGIPDAETVAAIELAARTEGLILDPTYTGKAMAGMVKHMRSGRWRDAGAIVFLHSGGAPGLFAGGSELLAKAHDGRTT